MEKEITQGIMEDEEIPARQTPEDEVRVDALVSCADCGTETSKIWDNGDGKDRCEDCAVKKYKRSAVTMLWPKQKPLTNCNS